VTNEIFQFVLKIEINNLGLFLEYLWKNVFELEDDGGVGIEFIIGDENLKEGCWRSRRYSDNIRVGVIKILIEKVICSYLL
jgi:hypothetical protein